MSKQVLIIGATGSQGGATLQALKNSGVAVRALSRNVESDKAMALKQQGIDVVQGDVFYKDSLLKAMSGVQTVFAVTTPFEQGTEKETEQGLALIAAAKEAEVSHFLFSSVSDADKATGIPHFDSKFKVEEALKQSGLKYTITAPVFFMDNLLSPWFLPSIIAGNISLAMPGDRKLQQISVRNIGHINASVISRGQEFYGRRINIAGDELTGVEAAKILSRAGGKSIGYQGFPVSALKEQNPDFGLMFEWFDQVGYSADVEKLKADFPEVSLDTFENWVKTVDWEKTLSAEKTAGSV